MTVITVISCHISGDHMIKLLLTPSHILNVIPKCPYMLFCLIQFVGKMPNKGELAKETKEV